MNNNKFPSVSIITVDYNGKHLLGSCLRSVFELDYPQDKIEVIMVDNGSIGESAEFVKNNFPRVKVIKNDYNNYCRANNLGINNSQGEYAALINNDAVLDKGWLEELIKVMGQDNTIGAATGKILFPDGRLQGAGHYEFPNFYWSDRGFKEEDAGQYNAVEEVPSISHCAALYRRRCLDDVGLLDEDLHMYMEDVDMCIRAKNKKWRLIYIPQGIVYHRFHSSADGDFANFYIERNRLLLIAKHYPQRLNDALFAKGYFTALNNRNDLINMLPSVFSKLIKHHDKGALVCILPGFFKEIDKILNMEKDHLAKQLDAVKAVISERDQEVARKNQEIHDRDQEALEKGRELYKIEQILQQQKIESASLKKQLSQIYESQTYRYIAIPLWKILDALKRLKPPQKGLRQNTILIIKPYYAGIAETENALGRIRRSSPRAKIHLVANLFERDYQRLQGNPDADEKIFYSPGRNRLTILGLIKLIFSLRRRKFDEAVILVGEPVYHVYRKAKLLAFFSGARKIKLFFAGTQAVKSEPRKSANLISLFAAMCASIASSVLLVLIIASFFLFIVFPLTLKRIFRR